MRQPDSRSVHGLLWTLILLLTWTSPAFGALPALQSAQGKPTLAPLLEQITPAVVNISVVSRVPESENPLMTDPFFKRFFGLPDIPQARPSQSVGSGVIVDADKGYVLTNNHVIENADEIVVTLKDKRRLDAKLVGSDPGTDIALLKIKPEGLQQLRFGNSDELKVGDFVVAVGNPFGLGQTVTSGIVSALGRSGLQLEGYEDFIQTDASINPGNSGGALVNLDGELVGINTAIIGPAGGNVGIGFAVPSNMAAAVMDQLIRFGEVRRGRLGIAIQDLTPDLAEALDVNVFSGAVVVKVEPDSAAEAAGIRPGDVITALNGRPIRGSSDLRNRVGLMQVGQEVRLELIRDGKRRVVASVIGAPKDADVIGDEALPRLRGAIMKNIDTDHPLFGEIEGVLVAEVDPGSAAWRSGLRKGDVIVAVNRRAVSNVSEMRDAMKSVERALALSVIRGNSRLLLLIQ